MNIYNFLLILLIVSLENNCSNNTNKNTILNVNTNDRKSQSALEASTTYVTEDNLDTESNLSTVLSNCYNLKYVVEFSESNAIPLTQDKCSLSINLKNHPHLENQLDTFIRENYQGRRITAETVSGNTIIGELVSVNDKILSIKSKDGILYFLDCKNINYYY